MGLDLPSSPLSGIFFTVIKNVLKWASQHVTRIEFSGIYFYSNNVVDPQTVSLFVRTAACTVVPNSHPGEATSSQGGSDSGLVVRWGGRAPLFSKQQNTAQGSFHL